MNNRTTELIFLIDKSGSMRGLERETIHGINTMLNHQRTFSGRVLVTTVLFSDNTEFLHDREELEAIRPLTRYDYYTTGCTALMDAIGETIGRIWTIQQYGRKDDVPSRTLFVIMTDGYENASRHYTEEQIRQLISDMKKNAGWEFMFFGATRDIAEAAGRIGISSDRTATFRANHEGIREHYAALSSILEDYMAEEDMTSSTITPLRTRTQWVRRLIEKLKDIAGIEPDEDYDWEE